MNAAGFRLPGDWAPELTHYQRNELRRRYRRARAALIPRDQAKWEAVRRARTWMRRRGA